MSATDTSTFRTEAAEALTVLEAGAALRVGRSKIYDLIRSKELRSFTVGTARRIPVSEISAYMRKRLTEDR